MKKNIQVTYCNEKTIKNKKRYNIVKATPKFLIVAVSTLLLMLTGCSETHTNSNSFQIGTANILEVPKEESNTIVEEKSINISEGYLVKSNDDFYSKLEGIHETILNGSMNDDLYNYFSNENLDSLYGNDAYSGHIRILFKYIANGDIYYPSTFEGRTSKGISTNNQDLNSALNQYADESLQNCYSIINEGGNEETLYNKIYNYFSYKGETILGVAAVKEPYRNHYYSTMEVYFRLIEKRNQNDLSANDEYILGILEICLSEMETLCNNYGYRIVITSLNNSSKSIEK